MVRERKQQIKIALSDKTREALELLASKTGASLAAEVRDLVEDGLYYSLTFDQKTNDLTRKLAILSRDVAAVSNGVAWHEHPAVHAALAEAIAVWLEFIKPSTGEKTVPPDYEPRAVGATVARMRMRASAETARAVVDLQEIDTIMQEHATKLQLVTEMVRAGSVRLKELQKPTLKRAKQKPRKKSK